MKRALGLIASSAVGYAVGVVMLLVWSGKNLYEDLTYDDEDGFEQLPD